MLMTYSITKAKRTLGYVAQFVVQHFDHCNAGYRCRQEYRPRFIKSILKSLVVPVISLAQIGAIYSQIAPFFALNHIIFPANEEVTLQTCGLSRCFRERLRYTVELSSNQK